MSAAEWITGIGETLYNWTCGNQTELNDNDQNATELEQLKSTKKIYECIYDGFVKWIYWNHPDAWALQNLKSTKIIYILVK